MKLRQLGSIWVWASLLVVCLGILVLTPMSTKEEVAVGPRIKSAPMSPQAHIIVQPRVDYLDIGLKIGSLLGGLMTLLNIIEKVVNLVRKPRNE